MNVLKFGSKSDVHPEYTCLIRLLDDSEPLTFTVDKDEISQELYSKVSNDLNLLECDYFGLRFADKNAQRHWIDLHKPVSKQMKYTNPLVLCFRVKFYPPHIDDMKEEISRYYLFLQLRRDLLHGRLYCPHQKEACMMAACIVQSEIGDYNDSELPPDYVTHFKIFPRITPEMCEIVAKYHRHLMGKTPAEAEQEFIERAMKLDTYGIDPYLVKDATTKGSAQSGQLYIGATYQGILVFHNSRRIHLFRWDTVGKIGYEGKVFIFTVYIKEEAPYLKKQKKRVCGFKCQSYLECKAVWQHVVEQRAFFTLVSSAAVPKVSSKMAVLSRGQKFRFSGRVRKEVLLDSKSIHRESPSFNRCISNPQFNRNSISSRPSSASSKHSLPTPQMSLDSEGLGEVEHMIPQSIAEEDEPKDIMLMHPIDIPSSPDSPEMKHIPIVTKQDSLDIHTERNRVEKRNFRNHVHTPNHRNFEHSPATQRRQAVHHEPLLQRQEVGKREETPRRSEPKSRINELKHQLSIDKSDNTYTPPPAKALELTNGEEPVQKPKAGPTAEERAAHDSLVKKRINAYHAQIDRKIPSRQNSAEIEAESPKQPSVGSTESGYMSRDRHLAHYGHPRVAKSASVDSESSEQTSSLKRAGQSDKDNPNPQTKRKVRINRNPTFDNPNDHNNHHGNHHHDEIKFVLKHDMSIQCEEKDLKLFEKNKNKTEEEKKNEKNVIKTQGIKPGMTLRYQQNLTGQASDHDESFQVILLKQLFGIAILSLFIMIILCELDVLQYGYVRRFNRQFYAPVREVINGFFNVFRSSSANGRKP